MDKREKARSIVFKLIRAGLLKDSAFSAAFNVVVAELPNVPEEYAATGQPLPYKPADGQW